MLGRVLILSTLLLAPAVYAEDSGDRADRAAERAEAAAQRSEAAAARTEAAITRLEQMLDKLAAQQNAPRTKPAKR